MIKRIGALLTAFLLVILMAAPAAFAGELAIEKSTPKDGDKGTAIDNLGVKIYFTEPMYSEKYNAQNEKCFKITDDTGKEIPLVVVFNKKEGYENQVLVLEDTNNDKYKVKADTEYTLTISPELVSATGDSLSQETLANNTMTFRTLNQKRTQAVNMAMMFVMMAVMMGATMRSTKKGVEEEQKKRAELEKVNPYKEAKKTGKSVSEIVAQEQKKREKYEAELEAERAEWEAEKAAEEAERQAAIEAALAAGRKHVSRPRPISEAGSTYKTGRKALAEKKAAEEAARKAKGTTNPKKGKKRKK